MINVELTGEGGEIIAAFPFPTSAKEVTYSQYLKFEIEHEKKEAWYEQFKGQPGYFETPAFRLEYCRHVLNAVEAFTGQKLGMAKFGSPVKGFKKWAGAKEIDIDETENTVMSLYAQIWQTLNTFEKANFEGEAYTFEYKGGTYRLKAAYRDALTNRLQYESLTAAQLIETLEALRVYERHKEKDRESQFLFTTSLNIIACTALKEGEAFPDTQSEIDKFVSKRIVHFNEISMEVAQNVKLFFLEPLRKPKGK